MTAAREFLGKLLRRAERGALRGAPLVRLPLSRAQCPRYFEMRDLQEAEAFRGELQAAAHAGAVALEALPGHTWPRDVSAASVTDVEKLAVYLGTSSLQQVLTHAQALLQGHVDDHPVVAKVLAAWSAGNKMRRAGPDQAAALLDSIRVVDARRDALDDALIRRESIRLFGRSKRIEALVPWIELLTVGDLLYTGLSSDDILASIGLFREPQPFLIAGTGRVLVDGTCVPLARPYLGLPVEAVTAFHFDTPPKFLMTVENKQTFHEAARLEGAREGVIVYTGGMPSPTWLRAYGLLIASAQPQLGCFHFGDVDLGGFRIASVIAKRAAQHGQRLRPWKMGPEAYMTRNIDLTPASASVVSAMMRMARELGWDQEAASIEGFPGTVEQEAVPVTLPA